jgi:mono/diheme cytochrome c family protein
MGRESPWPLRSSCGMLAGVLLCTAPAWAEPAWAANPQAVNAGKTLYIKYCATCHGHDGKGDGPLAGTLKTKPTDLTLLAKKNGGKFPYMEVLDIIDGNVAFPAHGSSELPAWGETFQSDAPGTGGTMDQAVVRGRLMLLTDYLRTIQTQ